MRETDTLKTTLTNGYYFDSGSLPAWQMRKCQSWLQWLLYSISSEKAVHSAFENHFEQCSDSGLFKVNLVQGDDIHNLTTFVEQLKDSGRKRTSLDISSVDQNKKNSAGPGPILKSIRDRLNWQYRHIDAVNAPAKLSISRLVHQEDEYAISGYASALQRRPNYPSDTTPQKVDSAETGTATHLVISKLDISNNAEIDKAAIRKLINQLISEGAVLETTAKCIDVDSIEAFFQSDLGKAATDINNNVMREWPFCIAITAAELRQIGGIDIDDRLQIPDRLNEKIIVQGIADMIIGTSKGLFVIDYKTDKITSSQAPDRAQKYRGQIALYTKAAEIILAKKVIGRYVWFLNCQMGVQV